MANLLRTYLTNPGENGRVLVAQTLKMRQVKFLPCLPGQEMTTDASLENKLSIAHRS